MGRFYRTAKPQFVRDNMFMPNLDLQRLLTQQKVKSNALKTQLLNEVPDIEIDYWDAADKDRVNDIKQDIEGRVEGLVQKIQTSKNPSEYMPEMKRIERELKERFTSGDINDIQNTAKGFRKYEADLKKLKNPRDREAYQRMTAEYLGQNPNERGVFEPGEMYSTESYWNDFIASNNFTKLGIDKNSKVTQDKKGGWLITNSEGTVELSKDKIENAFKSYVNSLENVEGRADAGAKYFGENNWRDESGQLDFSDKGHLGKMLKDGVGSYAYKNTTSSSTGTETQSSLIRQREAAQIRAEKRAGRIKAKADLPKGVKDASILAINQAQSVMDWRDDVLAELGTKYGLTNMSGNSFSDVIKQVEGIKGSLNSSTYNMVINELNKYQTKFDKGMYASYAPLKTDYGFTDTEVVNYGKELNDIVNKKGTNVSGMLAQETLPLEITNILKDKGINANNISINELQEHLSGIATVEIVEDAAIPHLLSKEDKHNEVQTSINFKIADTEESYKTDFYIPMTTIAGDNSNLLPANYSNQ